MKDFAYQVMIGPGLFLLMGGMTVLVAWLTVSYKSWKATRMDPVESLRSE
ncbi:MAG: ABC transporter permease [Balneolaceae bacterium]|nr:ABC transporter permease [Balneolaceae bacterium]